MLYKVGTKDEDNNFLCDRIFDTAEEAEYHREMWQNTEDQYGDHTRDSQCLHLEYIILKG